MEKNSVDTPEQPVNVANRRALASSARSATSSTSESLLKRFSAIDQGEKNEKKRLLEEEKGDAKQVKKKRAKKLSAVAEDVEEIKETRIDLSRKPLQQWPLPALQTIFDHVLRVAGENGFEFDAMRALALTCKRFAQLFALSPSASVPLIRRYVDAFFRERVAIRKFQLDNTPTKESLEPYYRFAEERETVQNAQQTTFTKIAHTLSAPCVKCCWKGVAGVPKAYISKSPHLPWHNNSSDSSSSSSSAWDRIKTKNWSIRNPLVRLVTIYAQSHAECSHASRFHAWVEHVKEWPLAKQRKPWSELIQWHDHPPTLALPPQ